MRHRVPMPWPDGEVIAWKCVHCDEWCNDGPDDGDCPGHPGQGKLFDV